MPHFVWFGLLGLLLLYAAGIGMFLARQRNQIHLRRYHPLLGKAGAMPLAVHAIWVNILHLGQSFPLMGWVGLATIAGVCFGYYAISQAKKTKSKKWRQIHWQTELGALIIATSHAFWFLTRILGS